MERNFEEFAKMISAEFEKKEQREKELEDSFNSGVVTGIKLMEQRMLLACENGTPIEIGGFAYFIHNDLQNLQRIFADIEANAD